MTRFTSFTIIFNPNSTGNSPDMARDFGKQLRENYPKAVIDLVETKHAGHAEELSYKAAIKNPDGLIISVSGDGGYNEVINGAARAAEGRKSKPICSVLPGGNANDHYSAVHDRPLIEAIAENEAKQMDLLQLTIDKDARFAHSYIGLGLTPLVATELNKHTLSALKEARLAIKTFWGMRPFEILIQEHTKRFDSLVFANINKMAKYLNFSEEADIENGQFEIIQWPHHSKTKLIGKILQSAVKRSVPTKKASEYEFKTVKSMPVQLDGEVMKIKADTNVTVTIRSDLLRTVY